MDITVIIPVKDQREHIGRTLDSILKSGIPPKEVIIVDNESTDGTYQFCEQYIKNRPNVTLLRETFPGAAAARNKGLKSCKTEWVYFFDADNLFDYNFISTFGQIDANEYDVVALPVKENANGREHVRTFIPSEDPRVQLIASAFTTPSLIFRTDYLRAIGAWDTDCRTWEDWELGIRLMLHQPHILWFTEKAFHTLTPRKENSPGGSLSMHYKELIRTLTAVMTDLHSSILQPLSHYHAQHLSCLYPHLDLLIYPLYLRANILLGLLQREKMNGRCKKYKMASKALTVFIGDNFTPTFSQRCAANWLRFCTMMGSKTAWKAALQVSLSKSARR